MDHTETKEKECIDQHIKYKEIICLWLRDFVDLTRVFFITDSLGKAENYSMAAQPIFSFWVSRMGHHANVSFKDSYKQNLADFVF